MEIENAQTNADRKEKRKEVLPLLFNNAQTQLRAALLEVAQREGRIDDVTNLMKASSVPELAPHLADMFKNLADGDIFSSYQPVMFNTCLPFLIHHPIN